MLDEIRNHPNTASIDVDTGTYYETLEQMIDQANILGCDAVVNCTGLGSRQLCSDDSLVGARGVLLHFDRRTCKRILSGNDPGSALSINDESMNDVCITIEDPPFGSETGPAYVIPRGDTLVVGGTYLEGDGEVAVRPSEKERLMENARNLGIDTDLSTPIGEWVGFRPYRPTVRLERDGEIGSDRGVRVVHNFGHGGSGWTVFAGVAKEAASLLVPESI